MKNSDINFVDSAKFKLNKTAFGFAVSMCTGGMLMFATWWILIFGDKAGAEAFGKVVGAVFFGYSVTFAGSLLGFAWGVVAGFGIGYAAAFLYNEACIYLEIKASQRSKPWSEKIDEAISPESSEKEKEEKAEV